MGRAEKVVLAYSGGVDTTVCIPYLMNEWGVKEVITLAADLGQGDELEPIRLKALNAGVKESLVADLTRARVIRIVFPIRRLEEVQVGTRPFTNLYLDRTWIQVQASWALEF